MQDRLQHNGDASGFETKMIVEVMDEVWRLLCVVIVNSMRIPYTVKLTIAARRQCERNQYQQAFKEFRKRR
jgi:hypothetical protein